MTTPPQFTDLSRQLLTNTVFSNPFIPQTPLPKQAVFLTVPHREALFGGAGGGGKSSALLMAALQYVQIPHYAALLFRKTFADLNLPGALMDRAAEWLTPTAAKWNSNEKTWTFPSGATLTFGYMENDADRFRYQGAEISYCAFDELTHFSEVTYRYLFSRLRRLQGSNVPIRMRAAANPGGVGHEWVRQRFLVDPIPGSAVAEDRIFIPARIEDNPHLDEVEYRQSLSELDDITRRQLELGDWDVHTQGVKFQRQWFKVIEPEDLPPLHLMRLARFWDLAATEPARGKDPDYTVGLLLGTYDGVYYVLDVQRLRDTPRQVELRVRHTAVNIDHLAVPIYMEQEPGSSGVNTIDNYSRRVLQGFTFYGQRTTGSKELRANPVSSAAQAGNIHILRAPWLTSFLDELEAFPKGTHDDQVDALSGAFFNLSQSVQRDFSTTHDAPRPTTGAYAPVQRHLLPPGMSPSAHAMRTYKPR